MSNSDASSVPLSTTLSPTSSSLLRRTGGTEGFYRHAWAGASSSSSGHTTAPVPTPSGAPPAVLAPPLLHHAEYHNNNHHRRSFSGPPVAPQAMERADQDQSSVQQPQQPQSQRSRTSKGMTIGPTRNITTGSLMPVGELGRSSSNTNNNNNGREVTSSPSPSSCQPARILAHPATVRARQRVMASIHRHCRRSGAGGCPAQESSVSRGDTTSITMHGTNHPEQSLPRTIPNPITFSKVTCLTYRGMEVLFGCTGGTTVLGMCARTRLVFQRLDLPVSSLSSTLSSSSSKSPVVAMLSHNETGQIVVVQANGMIHTYLPSTHSTLSDPTQVCYGRYRWYNGPSVHVPNVFDAAQASSSSSPLAPRGSDDNDSDLLFSTGLPVSLSHNYRLLVAHHTQLAVFDVSPLYYNNTNNNNVDGADLLWMTQLPGRVVTAKIAGDGEAIAVVLDDDDHESNTTGTGTSLRRRRIEDAADSDGVHTFERDLNDGAHADAATLGGSGHARKRHSLVRSRSVGIVYKPGPFLVHSAPVTQLAFRGQGHNTSNVDKSKEQGCDLLLTYSASNRTARIFNQNGWRHLTEWITPPRTRVEWIRGVSAFSLGDLENKKPTRITSATPSRRPSSNTLNSYEETAAQAINETLGKRHHYQSIPNHSTPTTHSGAWVAEVSFPGNRLPPSIRLSRLTYLKRGIDDMDPTLFETVSAVLPPQLITPEAILGAGEAAFSVEGIWPTWNTWHTESSEQLVSNETLRGSAMAYLGLSSGPAAGVLAGQGAGGMGQFGDVASAAASGPPSELRICASHVDGTLIVLEFPMLLDPEWNALELGNPRKTVIAKFHETTSSAAVSAIEIDRTPARQSSLSSPQPSPCPPMAATDYDASRLVAKVDPSSSSILITWHKFGTLSILPARWLPEDALSPANTKELLKERRKFKDESLVPAPLSLPSIRLSQLRKVAANESIVSLLWWLDENFGGPPLLVAITNQGTIIVFELPPPWVSQDPVTLRMDGSLDPAMGISATASNTARRVGSVAGRNIPSSINACSTESTYEVPITPDPQYGLGLRLEVQMDGSPAVAGSYKRHPLTGESLPAEKTGLITLGDELIAANEINLENKTFDDIIATVRDLGASCAGNPMRLTFRRVVVPPSAPNTPPPSERPVGGVTRISSPPPSGRRTMEEIIGVKSTVTDGGDDSLHQSRANHVEDDDKLEATNESGYWDNETHVAAIFDRALSNMPAASASEHVLVANSQMSFEKRRPRDRSAVIFHAGEEKITCVLLSLDAATYDPSKAKYFDIGTWNMAEKSAGRVLRPHSLQVVHAMKNRYHIFVCDSEGDAHMIVADCAVDLSYSCHSSKTQLSFQDYKIFELPRRASPDLILRSSGGVELLASMEKNVHGVGDEILVWEARPHPGCSLVQNEGKEEHDDADQFFADYSQSSIKADSVSTDDSFVDFLFVRTGFLDCSPSVIAFLKKQAVLFCKEGLSTTWQPLVQISYAELTGSCKNLSSLNQKSAPLCFVDNESPQNIFPHILTAALLTYSSADEKVYLRSDWHAESVLAHLYADERGTKVSLNDRVRQLFLWLYNEGKDIPEDYLDGPLIVSPLPILKTNVEPEAGGTLNDSSGVFAALAFKQDEFPDSRNLLKLRDVLACNCTVKPKRKEMGVNIPGHEHDIELPPILKSTTSDDILVLRSVCDLLLDPPNFDLLDRCGQHYLLSLSLLSKLRAAEKTPENTMAPVFVPSPRNGSPRHAIKKEIHVASSACLSALLSNSQGALIARCKQQGQQFSWDYVRELRIPLWLRSDKDLARIAEEIGQSMFRESRDIMECALFFIIAKKMRTLRNLAATDHTDSGKLFFKFLTTHDFSSERGRRAAEKNAFSLLRKLRYRVAAAFFLLAEPPSLTPALETIATKLHDIDLAFLVARLMESKELIVPNGNPVLGSGGVGGLGGILGGGGGYASTPVAEASILPTEDTKFDEWAPQLGPKGQKLLVERTLKMSARDCALTAVQLLWLGKKEEAAWSLTAIVRADYRGEVFYSLSQDPARTICGDTKSDGVSQSLGDEPEFLLEKTNKLIDFMSIPNLLTALGASLRARFAGKLVLASSLSCKGIELPSIETILQTLDEVDMPENEASLDATDASMEVGTGHDEALSAKTDQTNIAVQSSIFDSFTPQIHTSSERPSPAQASVFGSFDGPYQTNQSKVSNAHSALKSSIFDDFDVPAQTTMSKSALPVKSSIFDEFEVPQQAANVSSEAARKPSSSIFDEFDVASMPAKVNSHAKPTPSIFDEFDAAQKSTMTSIPASSIFDEFDTAPHVTKPMQQESPSPQTSIFEAYNVPSPVQPQMENASKNFEESAPSVALTVAKMPLPELWMEWRRGLLELTAARRLLREVATVIAQFHGDPPDPPIEEFYRSEDPLVPSGASGILQVPCDSDHILARIRQSLGELCIESRLEAPSVVLCALRLLGPVHRQHRTLFAVVLHVVSDRFDLAEDVLRAAAFDLMQICHAFPFSIDHLVHQRRTRSHVSTQFLRRRAARMSWQLETCLWLHRGGGLPLSGLALKEAIVAVRVGLLIASWNHNHECLEAMIRSEPDSQIDEEAGRHLWASLKLIMPLTGNKPGPPKTSSGGWEFLVDCRRSEATQILRDKKTGCFIIRPHAGDHGVFTLSFKTNLVPSSEENGRENEERAADVSGDEMSGNEDNSRSQSSRPKKAVRKDDVVQHAIIRLSESGYRCGSFGPFTTLISLLEAVSASLPFKLRFDQPPSNRVIREEGSQPSPNAVLLRKLALSHADSLVSSPPNHGSSELAITCSPRRGSFDGSEGLDSGSHERQNMFGLFLEGLTLSAIRKQLSAVIAAEYQDAVVVDDDSSEGEEIQYISEEDDSDCGSQNDLNFDFTRDAVGLAGSSRFLGPLLMWCRSLELHAAHVLAPDLPFLTSYSDAPLVDIADSAEAIEAIEAPTKRTNTNGGDRVLRKMIQRDSGIEFSTLRLVEGGECTLVIMFSQVDAVQWLLKSGLEESDSGALSRLQRMEKKRVIEAIDVTNLPLKPKGETEGVRYRILDPWEVEALHGWEGETVGASLGREKVLGFNLGKVGAASENVFRSLGGLPVFALWTSTKGGVVLTKAIASLHPPWERASGGDLLFKNGQVAEPPPFENSIRRHLYCNALFRRLNLPQRFLSIVQVELLDLKNLTSPGGSLSMSVYALLRMKRSGSSSLLSNKTRTLDTSTTHPVKLGKTSGPNAPASWGCVVRFRFPLPEDTSVDGMSFDRDRDVLFKGPPSVLQVTVYERKLLVDHALGTADIRMDGLWAGGQLEEWVPLRSDKHGITWFARVRLTLRFELMCLATDDTSKDLVAAPPSVGMRKILELSRSGGSVHEDMKRSVSSPDLITYFESMVY